MKSLLVALLLFVVGCGKNEAVRPVPTTQPPSSPPTQAPAPNGGGYYNPGGYYPPNNGGYYPPPPSRGGMPPSFQPQMPPGMPPQYYPFLPVDNYFRYQPQMAPYWNQVWTGWQAYAGQVGRSQYDFSVFWFDYCPQVWQGTSMYPVYMNLDQSFYNWVSPYQTFMPYADPNYFWANYSGMYYPY